MRVEITRDVGDVWIDFTQHVFASAGYLSTQSIDYGWLVSKDFALPFYVDKILIFRRLVLTAAPIVRDGALVDPEALQIFLDAAVDVAERGRICDFISKPQSNAVFDAAPRRSVSCPWGTYEISISKSDDALLKSFHTKHRNVINKAIRDGVTVDTVSDPRVVQENIRDTLLRQRLPYYPSVVFLRRLLDSLPGQLLMLGAFYKDQLQGVALVPFDSSRGYYLYGGSIESPYGGSLNFLQYEVMRRLRDKGVSYYDFVGARLDVKVGSKYEGIQRFKARFGADLRRGLAFRVVFSPTKFLLFNIMVKFYFAIRGRAYIDPIDQLKRDHEQR